MKLHAFSYKKCLYKKPLVNPMVVINGKWSELSLIKNKALLSKGTLVFIRLNLAFHAYVFFIIQILMIFGQIWCPTYFWSILLSYLEIANFATVHNLLRTFTILYLHLFKKDAQLFNALCHFSLLNLLRKTLSLIHDWIDFFPFLNLTADSWKGHSKKCNINQVFELKNSNDLI